MSTIVDEWHGSLPIAIITEGGTPPGWASLSGFVHDKEGNPIAAATITANGFPASNNRSLVLLIKSGYVFPKSFLARAVE